METLSYLILALAAVSAVAAIYVALKIKTVLYLLQQPVVKKMSPQLRLKPVKLDDVLDRNRNRGERGGDRDRNREGRPEGERREGGRERRDGRPEGERRERREGRPEGERREGRPEGERRERREPRAEGERREGRPEGERREGRPEGERRERREPRGEGERREGRPEGERREGGRDRNREDRPRREFSETRDFAPAPQNDAPSAESAPLSPRRPLFADAPASESSAPAPRESSADLFVGSSSDDLQHGRRTQLKKKPRFDIEEGSTEA